MSHAYHELPKVVLGDDCEECVERSQTIEGLASLDEVNLRRLVSLVAEMPRGRFGGVVMEQPSHASKADMRAVENLRLAARIVFASGITEVAAR